MYDLTQCQKLKEIGFPHMQSWMFWAYYFKKCDGYLMYITSTDLIKLLSKSKVKGEYVGVPTAEELLDWLRGKLNKIINIGFNDCNKTDKACVIGLSDKQDILFMTHTDTLSEAVYALAIWAHENKLLEGK